MRASTLLLANQVLYFNETTKGKEDIFHIFCIAWESIPNDKQKIIKKKLELIIIGRYEDYRWKYWPIRPIGITTQSPVANDKYRINWDPKACPDNNINILLHEFGHVFLDHPQKLINKEIADIQANIQVAKWKISTAHKIINSTKKVGHIK
jgi:hypothetical protein